MLKTLKDVKKRSYNSNVSTVAINRFDAKIIGIVLALLVAHLVL
ncbi:MAG TPA: hypothetical protein VF233_09550 [Nitrososphaeraceae archaeon]